MSIISAYRTSYNYYKQIDKVNELTSRFDDTRFSLCSPRSPNFLDEVALLPRAKMCSLVRDKQLENIAALLTELSLLQRIL